MPEGHIESRRRVWRFDLSTGELRQIEVDDRSLDLYLGGRGLNQLLLLRELRSGFAKRDPFDAETPLLFGVGPLVGTGVPGAIRLSVDTVNAFSGGVGSANVGGGFARALSRADIGTLMLIGRADEPVYLIVSREGVSVRRASHLWGLSVPETVAAVQRELGSSVETLAIGPAGENLVRGAAIMSGTSRAAAKCGVGAVMGAKRLKAVVVQPELQSLRRQSGSLGELCEGMLTRLAGSPLIAEMMKHGSLSYLSRKNAIGAVPFRHYQDGYIPERRLKKLEHGSFKRCEVSRWNPPGCPVKCFATYTTGKGRTPFPLALEGNSIQSFGFKLDIPDPAVIIKAHSMCNAYGIDADTVGEAIAWAYDCYCHGLLKNADTGGIPLIWGDKKPLLRIIRKIAYRQGVGELLAEGSHVAASQLGRGSEELAVTMKGQDVYETFRMPKGYGLGTALATRGGGHCSGSPLTEFMSFQSEGSRELAARVYGVEGADDPSSYAGKGQLVAFFERLHAVLNSVGLCLFASVWKDPRLVGWQDLALLLTAVTGRDYDDEKVIAVGERIHTLERFINWKIVGLLKKDDYPPPRFFTEPIRSGPMKGERLDRGAFEAMLAENYAAHGWDSSGLPQAEPWRDADVCECRAGSIATEGGLAERRG